MSQANKWHPTIPEGTCWSSLSFSSFSSSSSSVPCSKIDRVDAFHGFEELAKLPTAHPWWSRVQKLSLKSLEGSWRNVMVIDGHNIFTCLLMARLTSFGSISENISRNMEPALASTKQPIRVDSHCFCQRIGKENKHLWSPEVSKKSPKVPNRNRNQSTAPSLPLFEKPPQNGLKGLVVGDSPTPLYHFDSRRIVFASEVPRKSRRGGEFWRLPPFPKLCSSMLYC